MSISRRSLPLTLGPDLVDVGQRVGKLLLRRVERGRLRDALQQSQNCETLNPKNVNRKPLTSADQGPTAAGHQRARCTSPTGGQLRASTYLLPDHT